MDLGTPLHAVKPISGYQFAVFRIVFGWYLAFHFAHLLPWAAELFSSAGHLPDPASNFTYGILPNPLVIGGAPAFATAFVAALALLSILFAIGWARPVVTVALWFGAACLFNRNNLINNPSLAYVGVMLLLCALVPRGEPLVWRRPKDPSWFYPAWVFRTGWILMALGYTYSGLDKILTSPSWMDGTALAHVANLPLARPGLFRELLLSLPTSILALMTWGAVGLEILFLPLALLRKARPWIWLAMVLMHLGIIALVSFADLSLGMLMLHAFTFDPEWLPPTKPSQHERIVLFDGVCALCDRSMRLLLDEDRSGLLHFAPLQGETAKAVLARHPEADRSLSTVLYVRGTGSEDEELLQRSDAALHILDDLGGFWRALSWCRLLPRFVRDAVYDVVANNRYRWFGKYDHCQLPTAASNARFLP